MFLIKIVIDRINVVWILMDPFKVGYLILDGLRNIILERNSLCYTHINVHCEAGKET